MADQTQAAQDKANQKPKDSGKVLRIVSTIEGFRRAGVSHSKAAKHYPLDHFDKKQRELLEGEPNLIVDVVDAPKADATK